MNTYPESVSQVYFDAISRHKLLTAAEEIDLGLRARAGDGAAHTRLVESNLRLVVKIAAGYTQFGMSIEDLVSEGNLGLIRAAELFDPSRGVRFSTYAGLWIKQAIRRGLTERSRTIRLPSHVVEKLFKLNGTAARLSADTGREPSDSELGSAMQMPESKVRRLRSVARPLRSLDDSIDEARPDLKIMSVVADEATARPDESLVLRNLLACLERLLPALTPRERDVLVSRFGLAGRERETLDEVGARLDLTRERVRQIQNAAIAKLRKGFEQLDRARSISRLHKAPRRRDTKGDRIPAMAG